MSLNPVLDPGESQCYPYSIPFEPVAGATYRNNARITVTNDPRNPGEEMGPNEKVDFTLPDPTVVNGSVNVDDTNGLSWLFTGSGTETYTRTFRCDEDEGTHDNTATIRETGQSDDARVTVTCKPPPEPGCTLTQGYWKTHSKYGPAPYDATWALIGEDTAFFSSGHTWYQAIKASSAGGNAYYILAQQFIAAKLNLAGGTSSTPAVNAALAGAEAFFAAYTPSSTLSRPSARRPSPTPAPLSTTTRVTSAPGTAPAKHHRHEWEGGADVAPFLLSGRAAVGSVPWRTRSSSARTRWFPGSPSPTRPTP